MRRLRSGDPEPRTDERSLVARLRAGEEAAFEELFGSWFERLYRFALRRVGGDSELAREVAQATFCIAFEKLAGFRAEAPLFTWLCAICRSEISHHFRRQRHLAPVSEAVEAPTGDGTAGPAGPMAVSADDPEEQVMRDELTRQVRETVDSLPPHYGRVLDWKYGEGLKVEEIGTRLGTTTKAAESLLTRARVAFRSGFVRAGGRLPGRAP